MRHMGKDKRSDGTKWAVELRKTWNRDGDQSGSREGKLGECTHQTICKSSTAENGTG